MDWLGPAVGLIGLPLRLSVVLSAYAGVDILCIRSESVPRIGWGWRAGMHPAWGPPAPFARPLGRGDLASRIIYLAVLAIIQIQPLVWIGQAGSDAQRVGLIGLSAVFYVLELGWWVWLSRLPREKVYRTLPRDKELRQRMITEDVAQFDAAYRAGEVGTATTQDQRPR